MRFQCIKSMFREYLGSTLHCANDCDNQEEEEKEKEEKKKNIGSLISPRFSHFYDFMMRTRGAT